MLLLIACVHIIAQSKVMQMKQKNNFMMRMYNNQNLKGSTQKFNLKINPYWQDVDAPHTYNSYMPQVKVPCFGAVWARVDYDSLFYEANQFVRTADNGKTWKIDSVAAPAGYGLGTISPINANTCYASMYNAFVGLGGGIYKTTDGGDTWKKLNVFDDNSFPDFVYFFDAQHGLTVGDNNGDTSRLEIYTTCDAGKTWQRVSNQNIPPIPGYAYASTFNDYTVFQNRIWFKAFDNYGNNYIYRSDDFGKHWQQFSYTLSTPLFDFAFADKLNGVGVSFDFFVAPYVVVTHDGGATWSDVNFTGYPMGGFITVIPGTHVFVSTLPGTLTPVTGSSYSTDYGSTWKVIDSGETVNHSSVAYLNPSYGWTGRAETYDDNGGAYKWKLNFSNDNSLFTNDNASTSSATKNNLSNSIKARLFPNPSKDVININGLSASSKTMLSLYTISGRLIQQVTANAESYSFNIEKLPAGNYYITIQSGEKIATLKFVKE